MPEFTRHPHHGPYLSALPVFYLKGELDLNLKGGFRLLNRVIPMRAGHAPPGRPDPDI
jgi:hypothetical protein